MYGSIPSQGASPQLPAHTGDTEQPKRWRAAWPSVLLSLAVALVVVIGLRATGTARGTVLKPSLSTEDASVQASAVTQPNIIFILADDLAWNAMGYNGYDLGFATPMMQHLAKNGIIFDSFYGEHLCTPARAALLTGRYPIHTGMQEGLIDPSAEWGLPLDEVLFPRFLQSSGYATHMVGKWHLGHYSPGFLPTARGFDTYLGYLAGEESYYTHKYSHAVLNKEWNDFLWSNTTHYRDAAIFAGEYSLQVYTNRVRGLIMEHDIEHPLFLYASTQNVHTPLIDLPDDWFTTEQLEALTNVSGTARQEYAKSLMMLDHFVGELVEMLDDKGMLDNTYIFFSSDNGGCSYSGGRNGPLRGEKGSLYDGGVKVDAWVWSPLLPESARGFRYPYLTHLTDWYPTILTLANVDPFENDEDIPKPLDGLDLAPLILGDVTYFHGRRELVHNLEVDVDGETLILWANASAALRVNDMKLIHEYYKGWDPIEEDDDSDDNKWSKPIDCADSTTNFTKYVFNMYQDPYEERNVIDEIDNETYVHLYERLSYYAATTVESEYTGATIASEKAATTEWKKYNDTITPWNFTHCGMFLISGCE